MKRKTWMAGIGFLIATSAAWADPAQPNVVTNCEDGTCWGEVDVTSLDSSSNVGKIEIKGPAARELYLNLYLVPEVDGYTKKGKNITCQLTAGDYMDKSSLCQIYYRAEGSVGQLVQLAPGASEVDAFTTKSAPRGGVQDLDPILQAGRIQIPDDTAVLIFEQMTSVVPDASGMKLGKALSCSEVACDLYYDAKGAVGSYKQIAVSQGHRAQHQFMGEIRAGGSGVEIHGEAARILYLNLYGLNENRDHSKRGKNITCEKGVGEYSYACQISYDSHGAILKPGFSLGAAPIGKAQGVVYSLLPMQQAGLIELADDSAERVFNSMTEVSEDERGQKTGAGFQCNRMQNNHYLCLLDYDAFGNVGSADQVTKREP